MIIAIFILILVLIGAIATIVLNMSDQIRGKYSRRDAGKLEGLYQRIKTPPTEAR